MSCFSDPVRVRVISGVRGVNWRDWNQVEAEKSRWVWRVSRWVRKVSRGMRQGFASARRASVGAMALGAGEVPIFESDLGEIFQMQPSRAMVTCLDVLRCMCSPSREQSVS